MKQIIVIVFSVFCLYSCKKEDSNVIVNADFDFEITEDTINRFYNVKFINKSKNAERYYWDFFDGTISTEINPIHKFSTDSYFIFTKLIVFNGAKSDTITKRITDEIFLEKPNIYLYPLNKINLQLNVLFPKGGQITNSIPKYNTGWYVSVDSTSLIDNKYDFLFYESIQPDNFQYNNGWCVKTTDLETFFKNILKSYNFSENEMQDFIEFWKNRLVGYKYYLIYPQTNEIIEKVVKLEFSIKPNNINRVFFGFKGVNVYENINSFSIDKFKREGFYIVEWGGFIK